MTRAQVKLLEEARTGARFVGREKRMAEELQGQGWLALLADTFTLTPTGERALEEGRPKKLG